MRRIGVIATTFVLAGALGSGGAMGAKVNLPKEGKYAFDFCPIGHGRNLLRRGKVLCHELRP